MKRLFCVVALAALGCGCSSAAETSANGKKGSNAPNADSDTANNGGDNSATNTGANGDPNQNGTTSGPQATSTGKLAVVTIDVQQVFFDTATKRNANNVTGRMPNTAHVFEIAGTNHLPIFLTFEATKSGDHALPPSLATALPTDAQQFIKTTFAATSQPQFKAALQTAGIQRALVLGAETDVCILQTMLGLRRAGVQVLALNDALFTEEVNTAPALRRLHQAGVIDISLQDAETLIASGGTTATPAAPDGATPPVIVEPLAMGFVLNDLEGLNAADPNSSQKMVRLRELLLISEWFKLPLLAANPTTATAALPANLRSIITRPILALSALPATVKQLGIAGGHTGIADLVTSLRKASDVFVIEDTLLGGTAAELEPLYVNGAIPTTYKAMYYELTQSVDDAGWPSQQWVKDGDTFFDLTMAPEELPPLTP